MTHNDCFTKQKHAKELFSRFIESSIIWAQSKDPFYKSRRKVISHAFYASKLKAMSDIVFKVIHERLLKWEQIYPSGELDMVSELISL